MTIQKQCPNVFGYHFKTVARALARRNFSELYFQKIDSGLFGKDNNDNLIPVDTLGKLIFGVPGCSGRFIFDGSNPDCLVVRQIYPIPSTLQLACYTLINSVLDALARGEGEYVYSLIRRSL